MADKIQSITEEVVLKTFQDASVVKAVEELLVFSAEASGPRGLAPAHEWDGTRLRFKNPDGTWGDWVELGSSVSTYIFNPDDNKYYPLRVRTVHGSPVLVLGQGVSEI